jgi:ELWxxDGT repeat protein
VYNSNIYFTGYDTLGRSQLWSTDGTAAGTKIIKADSLWSDKYAGFNPGPKVIYRNKLYMSAWDSVAGTQLWSSDGSYAGTKRITTKQGGSPQNLFVFQDKLIMMANDSSSKMPQVIVSDGTAAGMICPKPPVVNNQAFYPWRAWVPFNNSLYFVAAYTYWQWYEMFRLSNIASLVEDPEGKIIPGGFALSQNYPNPFNPSTTLWFSLPSRSFVTLKIFDVMGREVSTITSEEMPAGDYSRTWDASAMSSGVYFYRLQAGSYTETKRLILLR